jgi:hypothetical protein
MSDPSPSDLTSTTGELPDGWVRFSGGLISIRRATGVTLGPEVGSIIVYSEGESMKLWSHFIENRASDIDAITTAIIDWQNAEERDEEYEPEEENESSSSSSEEEEAPVVHRRVADSNKHTKRN